MQAVKLNIQARKSNPIDTQTSSEIIQQFKRLLNVFPSINDINVGDSSGNSIGLIRQPDHNFILTTTEAFPKRNWYLFDANGRLGNLFKNDTATFFITGGILKVDTDVKITIDAVPA